MLSCLNSRFHMFTLRWKPSCETLLFHNFSDFFVNCTHSPFDRINGVSRYTWLKGVVGRVTLWFVSFSLPWAFVIAVLSVLQRPWCWAVNHVRNFLWFTGVLQHLWLDFSLVQFSFFGCCCTDWFVSFWTTGEQTAMTVKRPISDEAIQFMDNALNENVDGQESDAPDLQLQGEWDDSLVEEQQLPIQFDTGFPDVDEVSVDEPIFIHPRPKYKPSNSQASSSSAAAIDPLVSRSINSLVQERLSESLKQPASFLDSMSFDSAFSLDKIWKAPQLPDYGRFEALSAAALEAPVQSAETSSLSFQFRKKRLLAASFARTDDQLEMNAMRKLREIVLYRPQDSRLGRALLDVAGRLVPEQTIQSSFADSVAGKAPGTIAKRVADYHRFSRWAVENGICGPMQLSEPVLYQYAQHLKNTGASATSLQSFLKAIGFFEHHIGFAGADIAVVISGRVTGISKMLLATKRELHQAPPMTADDVYKLERFVCHANDKDACIGGFLLFTLFASARFADAARATSVRLETADHIALLESSTLKFKTANSAGNEMRNVALPMLALGSGLYVDQCWGERWLNARKAERLDTMPCLMPAWSEVAMGWLTRPMTSGEGVWRLRELLVAAGVEEDRSLGPCCTRRTPWHPHAFLGRQPLERWTSTKGESWVITLTRGWQCHCFTQEMRWLRYRPSCGEFSRQFVMDCLIQMQPDPSALQRRRWVMKKTIHRMPTIRFQMNPASLRIWSWGNICNLLHRAMKRVTERR